MKIGITGTIASGKSTASAILRKKNYPVFDADECAHSALQNAKIRKELVSLLGDEILVNHQIDRTTMASIIFHDEGKRERVNQIIHPYVINKMDEYLKQYDTAFAEVPLLFEAHLQSHFDQIWVVTCKKETAIQRMMNDRGYSYDQAISRYNHQIPVDDQIRMADIVIHNDDSLVQLEERVEDLLKDIKDKEYGR